MEPITATLIVSYIAFGLILLFAGWAFKSKKSKWGRFIWMWFLTMILSGIVMFFLIYSPNTVQMITNFLNKLIV